MAIWLVLYTLSFVGLPLLLFAGWTRLANGTIAFAIEPRANAIRREQEQEQIKASLATRSVFPAFLHAVLFLHGPASARFTAVRIGSGGVQGIGTGPYDTGGGFVEEYLLEDFELSPADLGE